MQRSSVYAVGQFTVQGLGAFAGALLGYSDEGVQSRIKLCNLIQCAVGQFQTGDAARSKGLPGFENRHCPASGSPCARTSKYTSAESACGGSLSIWLRSRASRGSRMGSVRSIWSCGMSVFNMLVLPRRGYFAEWA